MQHKDFFQHMMVEFNVINVQLGWKINVNQSFYIFRDSVHDINS